MNPLRQALLTNAIFSGTTGIILLAFYTQVAEVFGASNEVPFWVIGVGLLFFTATLALEIKRQNLLGILLIILQDFLWVILSAVLLIWRPFGLSTMGLVAISVVALIVLILAIRQVKGLSSIDMIAESARKQLRYEQTVAASKARVWEVISDVANYDQVAPNIDRVKIMSGEGEGMVRSCGHNNDQWTETCTLWEEERQYSFLVDTESPDYPYPLSYLKGTWMVEEVSASRTKVIMVFEFSYAKNYQNWLLHPLMKVRFQKIVDTLLENWRGLLESK